MTSRTEWLRQRSQGIGGSEIAAIMGLDEWATPYSIWERKTGRLPDQGENKFARAGKFLESAVADMFQEETGFELYEVGNTLYMHPEYNWLIGTPDRFVKTKSGDGILEIKTTQKRVDKEDNFPLKWFFQLQWYMGITGKKRGWIAWLISGVDFDFMEVEYDQQIFSDMAEAGRDFWFNHIVPDVPPPPISREDIARIVGKVLPEAVEGTEETIRYHALIKENSAKIKELEDANDQMKEGLQLLMMDKSVLTYHGATLFTWKEQKRTNIDLKALAEDWPGLLDKYTTEKKIRVFLTK